MAASPQFKVFDRNGTYQASCKDVVAAAVLVAWYGENATIRYGHNRSNTIWTEGKNGQASESYQAVEEYVSTLLEAWYPAAPEEG